MSDESKKIAKKLAEQIETLLQRNPKERRINAKLNYGSHLSNEETSKKFSDAIAAGYDVALTTGCGMPSRLDEMPLRLGNLVIPAMEMMAANQTQANVSYHVYQAKKFVTDINHIEPNEAEKTSAFMQTYLQEFVDTFYSDQKRNVSFDFDKTASDNDIQPVIDFLRHTEDKQAKEYMNNIVAYADQNPDRGCPYTYAAANIYYNLAQHIDSDRPTVVMPVGGQKEKPFFYLTALYAAESKMTNIEVIPLIASSQSIPAYFPHRAGDLTIKDFNENNMNMQQLSGVSRDDYNNLLLPVIGNDMKAITGITQNALMAVIPALV